MKVHIIDKCCNVSRTYIDSFKMVNNIDFVDTFDDADVICYIGCAYQKQRIDQCSEYINDLIKKKKKDTKLAIFGCITSYKDFYNNFLNVEGIDYIGCGYGQDMQKELTKYLETLNNEDLCYTEMGINFENSKRINIVVQDGCSRRCAFCKSNYLNFKLRSTPLDIIISQINHFTNIECGVTEVNISGLNPTEYGLDLYHEPKLTELIREISKIPTVETILLESLCPDRINEDLLYEIINNPKIKRIMIPIQSMDDNLLKLMGRKNTAEQAYNILKIISTQRPDIFIETIFLICYPTENKESIIKNIKLLEDIKIHNPVLSVYTVGKNVKTLRSEHIANISNEEHQQLLKYYRENMIPLIEEQRRILLSKPIEGTLVYSDENYDYYSTLYRFTTHEFIVKCPKEYSSKLEQKALIQSEFLQSIPGYMYTTETEMIKGKVLKKTII